MDPLEVGEKVLAGMSENRALIFTHPEYAEDFAEIYRESVAALPDEPVPEAASTSSGCGARRIAPRRRASASASTT